MNLLNAVPAIYLPKRGSGNNCDAHYPEPKLSLIHIYSTLANEPVTNWARMERRRVSFSLGINNETPTEKLKICLEKIRTMLENHPAVHKDTIFAVFDQFNEGRLEIFFYFFTITPNWGEFLKIKEDVNFKIMAILEEEEVSLAFPSRSVYLQNDYKK